MKSLESVYRIVESYDMTCDSNVIWHKFTIIVPSQVSIYFEKKSIIDEFNKVPLYTYTELFLKGISYEVEKVLENPYKFLRDLNLSSLANHFIKESIEDYVELSVKNFIRPKGIKSGENSIKKVSTIVITKKSTKGSLNGY